MYTYEKPDNLVDLFEESVAKYPDNEYFGTKDSAGVYRWVTFGEVGKRVDNLRAGLAGIGLEKGEAVGIIADNRTEFAVVAFAAYGRGARFVPMYEKELVKVWKYIISDSAVKVLFVSKPEIFEKVKGFLEEIPTLEAIYVIDREGAGTMAELETKGSEAPVESYKPAIEEIAALIYTSGTTGDPKGVLLSHGNFTSNVHAAHKLHPELSSKHRSLSILPWAHSFGMVADLYMFTKIGGSLGFLGSVATLTDDIAAVRPTFLVAVPRVFNKIYASVVQKMEDEGGIAKKLFEMGVNAAETRRKLKESGGSSLTNDLKFWLADKIVFQKIRDKFGGRLEAALTGSAATNVNIAFFFNDIGIPLYDAYGLTETTPAVSVNSPSAHKFGSVGQVIDQVKVVIDSSVVEEGAADGEIVVYGPNIMQGYHNKPDATKEVINEEGGFRTGDRGRIDKDGFLYITGRIKEQYKLENGKYVFPAAIEEEMKLLPAVENAMVHGANMVFNICLLVPDPEYVKRYAGKNGLSGDEKELVANSDLQKQIVDEVTESLKGKFGSYEIPKKFIFIDEPFTLENGMLTQTMKLKRRVAVKKYEDLIEQAYQK